MNMTHVLAISNELSVNTKQVSATAELLLDGATVPFIARYRKERTGQLDEVQITAVRDRLRQLEEIDSRRAAIVKSLEERELMTDELSEALNGAETLSRLEDIYLPHRPKRRTRATIAREKGLEPLADQLFSQSDAETPTALAEAFLDPEKEVNSVEEALAGARDIIAERVNEDTDAREEIRRYFEKHARIESRVMKKADAETKGAKFRDYFEWHEAADEAPSHRVLAMLRGEAEGVLHIYVRPPEQEAIDRLKRRFVRPGSPVTEQVELAVEDAYRRLLQTSMEVEARMQLRKKAGDVAIQVFADNVRELLMAPPLGGKAVLAIDPGFRTGCKTVCLDAQGKLLFNATLHLTKSQRQAEEAGKLIVAMCEKFGIEAIAVGNGTGGRETETLVRSLPLPAGIVIVLVNESGASIYSASQVAREEFPDHDVTVRGAVSIGRRLMDPLAELVKIDPKSIGVGQYQHDVDQTDLKHTLDDTVVSCVNNVGVEVNTASTQLLSYVSGLGPALAKNIVEYRDINGPIARRRDLLKVPRLGPKAFEQAAGFLRIRDGKDPLDASAVHPESYSIVKAMAKDLGCTVADLMRDESLRAKIDLGRYETPEVGMPTLRDILAELAKPGRDPRESFEAFTFADVHDMRDLKPGMKLPGIVTNVTKFGAFVDVGVHQDGLVHISELADRFVSDPGEIVKVQQKVTVTVLDIDQDRRRIALSLRAQPELGGRKEKSQGNTGNRRRPGRQDSPGGRQNRSSSQFNANPFADAF